MHGLGGRSEESSLELEGENDLINQRHQRLDGVMQSILAILCLPFIPDIVQIDQVVVIQQPILQEAVFKVFVNHLMNNAQQPSAHHDSDHNSFSELLT